MVVGVPSFITIKQTSVLVFSFGEKSRHVLSHETFDTAFSMPPPRHICQISWTLVVVCWEESVWNIKQYLAGNSESKEKYISFARLHSKKTLEIVAERSGRSLHTNSDNKA